MKNNMTLYETLPTLLRNDYTQYYQTNSADSTLASRNFLIGKLLSSISQPAVDQIFRILDLGAGRQILEAELAQNLLFQQQSAGVEIVTVDIADIEQPQLLAPLFHHIQASGTDLPFTQKFFDLVVSSSALDFMPQVVFAEIWRVLKPHGKLLATLHHQSLIEAAQNTLPELESKLRGVDQKLKFGARSKKINKYQLKRKKIEQQIRDAQFILTKIPQLIFSSVEEIESTLLTAGLYAVETEEYPPTNQQNGWYFVHAVKG